jgi:hypothetical protein
VEEIKGITWGKGQGMMIIIMRAEDPQILTSQRQQQLRAILVA